MIVAGIRRLAGFIRPIVRILTIVITGKKWGAIKSETCYL